MMSKWPNNPESVPHKTDYFLFGETENKTLQSWCCHPHFLILELCFFLYKIYLSPRSILHFIPFLYGVSVPSRASKKLQLSDDCYTPRCSINLTPSFCFVHFALTFPKLFVILLLFSPNPPPKVSPLIVSESVFLSFYLGFDHFWVL